MALLSTAATVHGSDSPDGALPELPEPPSIRVPVGELAPGIACLSDPTQTYTLYLPTGYSTPSPGPLLFIFDPRGRSEMAAEIFREAAERYGWILMSSDNTRSDGPWEPNFRAIDAMVPDIRRYAVDEKRLYAAGFSGGAMLAWIWAQDARGGVAGVISSGSRPVKPTASETAVPFAHFAAAGEAEFNYLPTLELDAVAARLGAPHRFESFPGPHAWMPQKLAFEAVEWMELQAMRAGKRAPDPKLVATLYEKDLAAARELEEAGKLLAAQRRYDAIGRTFESLRDTDSVIARAAELERVPEVVQALEAEKNAWGYERARLQQMGRAIGLFRAQQGSSRRSAGMTAAEFETELRLAQLLDTAEEPTPKGLAARRVLNSLSAQLGFYLPREYLANGDYARAAVVLEIAAEIGPPNPFVLYNLASAHSRLGRRKRALEALEAAIAAGFSNLEHLEQDPDLDKLRDHPDYLGLVAGLQASATLD